MKTENEKMNDIPDVEKERIADNWAKFETRFANKPFIPETEAQKAYLHQVNHKEAQTIEAITKKAIQKELKAHKQPKQVMQYDVAKTLLWRIMNAKLASEGRTFEHAGNDLEVIQNLLKYFIGDNSSKYDLRKGICLAGDVGMGKTFLMECFQSFCSAAAGLQKFRKVGCGDVFDDIAAANNPQLAIMKYYKGNVFFDDLGNEPEFFKHFGNEFAYMDRIMFKREESFRVGYCMTHFTTNLNGRAIEARYGKRFFDRFKKMLNVIVMTAPSKRN